MQQTRSATKNARSKRPPREATPATMAVSRGPFRLRRGGHSLGGGGRGNDGTLGKGGEIPLGGGGVAGGCRGDGGVGCDGAGGTISRGGGGGSFFRDGGGGPFLGGRGCGFSNGGGCGGFGGKGSRIGGGFTTGGRGKRGILGIHGTRQPIVHDDVVISVNSDDQKSTMDI